MNLLNLANDDYDRLAYFNYNIDEDELTSLFKTYLTLLFYFTGTILDVLFVIVSNSQVAHI